jgi:putative membrane protein
MSGWLHFFGNICFSGSNSGRYSDGRKAWATLSVQSRNLARYIWIHVDERPGHEKEDLLAKMSVISSHRHIRTDCFSTGINLILAFAIALKHKLRFEPYQHYPDIASLTAHLDTFAKAASSSPEARAEKPKTPWKRAGEFLGMSLATSNPRKSIKRASMPLGNLPLEILMYISAYVEGVSTNGSLKSTIILGQIMNAIASLTDTQAQAERVLSTPLPLGYNILISQIVLIYVYLLPFQLVGTLEWVTIPATIAASYIIVGLAAIGNELENPFGNDVNDLPLDVYCEQLRGEFDVITASAPPKLDEFWKGGESDETQNKVLWPLSSSGAKQWHGRSVADIRTALKAKVAIGDGVKNPLSRDGKPSSV